MPVAGGGTASTTSRPRTSACRSAAYRRGRTRPSRRGAAQRHGRRRRRRRRRHATGEHADASPAALELARAAASTSAVDDLDHASGRVVRRERARRPRRRRRRRAPSPSSSASVSPGDAAEPQHAQAPRRAVDDRRLDPDRARPAVEHERRRRRRGRGRTASAVVGTHPAESVRRRRGDATAERAEQRPARADGPAPADRRCRARRCTSSGTRDAAGPPASAGRASTRRPGARAASGSRSPSRRARSASAPGARSRDARRAAPSRRTAGAARRRFSASAPSPYTVSVGNATSPPRRRQRAIAHRPYRSGSGLTACGTHQ